VLCFFQKQKQKQKQKIRYFLYSTTFDTNFLVGTRETKNWLLGLVKEKTNGLLRSF